MTQTAVTIRRIVSVPDLQRSFSRRGMTITLPGLPRFSVGDDWTDAVVDPGRSALVAALVLIERGTALDYPERVGHWRFVEPQDVVGHRVWCLAPGCDYSTDMDHDTNAVNWMLGRTHWLDQHQDISETPFLDGARWMGSVHSGYGQIGS